MKPAIVIIFVVLIGAITAFFVLPRFMPDIYSGGMSDRDNLTEPDLTFIHNWEQRHRTAATD